MRGSLQLIVSEVPVVKIITLFEDDHIKTRGGEFLGHDAAGDSRADHDKINLSVGVKLCHKLLNLSQWSQPGCLRRRNNQMAAHDGTFLRIRSASNRARCGCLRIRGWRGTR